MMQKQEDSERFCLMSLRLSFFYCKMEKIIPISQYYDKN